VSPKTSKQDSQANGSSAQAAQEWARQATQYLRARQLATQAQLAPRAVQARIAAQQGLLGARTWTAPQLDRLGLALQEQMAPQMAAALSAAARRIEPTPPQPRRRWLAVAVGAFAVAGGAVAAVIIMNRRNSNGLTQPGEADETATAPGAPREMDAVGADVNGQTQAP
jgi:hypothetical protein